MGVSFGICWHNEADDFIKMALCVKKCIFVNFFIFKDVIKFTISYYSQGDCYVAGV